MRSKGLAGICHSLKQFANSRVSLGLIFLATAMISALLCQSAIAQGTTNGGFAGVVKDKDTGAGIPGARIVFTNLENGLEVVTTTAADGTYSKKSLPAGPYKIIVSAKDYVADKTAIERMQTLYTMSTFTVLPDFLLVKEGVVAVNPNPSPVPVPPVGVPAPAPSPTPGATTVGQTTSSDGDETNSLSARRGGIFDRRSVVELPLGSTTYTRTFDEHALLVPGVAPPPQTIGNTAGPGIGGGIGTSGQFSVNGLRSRANNFTVDGSDNNDEDIGVRRQGFFTLVPQPIESIQEFQIITLLAPAEFGRNLGAQVNALSRSGGNQFHGSIYGSYNSDKLNATNFFDNTGGNSSSPLTAQQSNGNTVPVIVDGEQRTVTNNAGGEDPFKFYQVGGVVGGPIVKNKAFFFVSAEGQWLKGSRERHFAVPTVEQRGFVGSGAGGLRQCRLDENLQCVPGATFVRGYPTALDGDFVYSLFPFANDPTGIYGRNTYTQQLSTDARGGIFSGKVDWNLFRFRENQQVLTMRYNFTDDRRDLTDVGGALFSAIRPMAKTDNFSAYLTGSLNDTLSNELRVSWGRTRLHFEELRDTTGFLQPVSTSFNNPEDAQFLLNARVLFNNTLPVNCTSTGCSQPAAARYDSAGFNTEDFGLGLVGQVNIAGFSPVGVDVFNFPQRRTNNTYQFADTLRKQAGRHSIAFGADIRRVYLASELPRNSRPLVTFNGSPDGFDLCNTPGISCNSNPTLATNQNACGISRFCSPTDLAAIGGAGGFFQTLVLPGKDSSIDLRYNQFDFFVQDEWRIRPRISLSLGLRYEYNTTPREKDNKIESTFTQPLPDAVAQLAGFIDGRTNIYDADKNNFAPRIGVAAELTRRTLIRGGFGLYYDQILGAVVSQSRNVFPTFTTVNFGGGLTSCFDVNGMPVGCNDPNSIFTRNSLFNPINAVFTATGIHVVQPGTLNTINPVISQEDLLNAILLAFPNFNFNNGVRIAGSPFGATLPVRKLDTPYSQQYSVEIEHQFGRNNYVSAAYVGTRGKHLLRFTNPNLGSNFLPIVRRADINPADGTPFVNLLTLDPTANPYTNLFAGRPTPLIGQINQFETTGTSTYNSLQIEAHGRLNSGKFQYRVGYVYGKVDDDVSDVFDLAGAFTLPQNSLTFDGERGPANFDVRHQFTYDFIYSTPGLRDQRDFIRYIFGDWQIAGTGKVYSGQPFTVNTIYDVNLDGNITDRLDNTNFLVKTNRRLDPLSLTCSTRLECESMLAPFGKDGSVGRNVFRAGNLINLDMSLSRRFRMGEDRNLQFRMDFFNFINRDNFGVPVRVLEAPGFGRANETVTPSRRIQFWLKYNF